jgi:hypothetical protein
MTRLPTMRRPLFERHRNPRTRGPARGQPRRPVRVRPPRRTLVDRRPTEHRDQLGKTRAACGANGVWSQNATTSARGHRSCSATPAPNKGPTNPRSRYVAAAMPGCAWTTCARRRHTSHRATCSTRVSTTRGPSPSLSRVPASVRTLGANRERAGAAGMSQSETMRRSVTAALSASPTRWPCRTRSWARRGS